MKSRIYLYSIWALLPIVTILRTWQLNTAIDPENGFYLDEYSALCHGLQYGLLVLLLAAFLVGRFLLSNNKTVPRQSWSIGIAGILVALSTVIQAGIDYTSTGSWIYLLCGLATGFGFTVISTGTMFGKQPMFIASVLPVAGELIRLIVAYSHFNGIADISETLIQILFMCSFLSFCLFHSRVYTGIGTQKGVGWLYGTATATGVFGICASVPHWIAGQNQFTLSIMNFAAALYAIVYLSVLILGKPQPVEGQHLAPQDTQQPLPQQTEEDA